MADWYYTKGSDRFGPIDEAELRRRLQSGEITPNDWIWREGLRGWVKVADWPGRIQERSDSAITGDVVTATPLDPPGRSGVVNGGLESDLQAAGAVSERMLPVRQLYERVLKEVRKIFVGQDELVLGTLTALFSGGHVLIESVPGLGKTLFVRTLGRVLGC
jgi:hypothetical protein